MQLVCDYSSSTGGNACANPLVLYPLEQPSVEVRKALSGAGGGEGQNGWDKSAEWMQGRDIMGQERAEWEWAAQEGVGPAEEALRQVDLRPPPKQLWM